MSAGNVIVLTSIVPTFSHLGHIVLGNLIEQMAAHGAQVQFAIAGTDRRLVADEDAAARLARVGVRPVDGPAPLLDGEKLPNNAARRVARYMREAFDPSVAGDAPRFLNPKAEVDRLLATGARSALLFWDSYYERLVPALASAGMRVYGYLARPPMAAAQVHADEKLRGFKRVLTQARLESRQRRHLARLRHLSGARNICALDAAWYDRHDVSCGYLPNTWPDAYGDAWKKLRREAEGRRRGIHILGNVGELTATGNMYGMTYLADRVLPLLDGRLAGLDWMVNICGRFGLPPALDGLRHQPHVAIRGFVPDIDEEVLGNHIFLLLNNAGPYTGGYTRVIFAFSAGSCLVAHNRLAESMPELVHDRNCLLADTPEGIADLVAVAATDAILRNRISEAARRTYLKFYHPGLIAESLLRLMIETK
jgi:hypothetical protein